MYRSLMNNEHHYVTFNNYLKATYHDKTSRISLNLGLTCPNRDGAKGWGGCAYCSAKLSGDFSGNPLDSLEKQFSDGIKLISSKWPVKYYIAYLQAGSNTYANISFLKEQYEKIINLSPNIKVLSIATRPDCIDEDTANLLKQINGKCEVWVELGLQTSCDETKSKMGCMHTNADFEASISLLKQAGIKVIVHVINGLPGEEKEQMIETIKYVNKFNPFGVKIHMLHLMKNTPLYEQYQKEPFKTLTLNEYVEIVSTQLAHLNTSIIIHRLTGDSPKDLLVEPLWTLKKFVVLNEIDKYMRKNNIYQGDLC